MQLHSKHFFWLQPKQQQDQEFTRVDYWQDSSPDLFSTWPFDGQTKPRLLHQQDQFQLQSTSFHLDEDSWYCQMIFPNSQLILCQSELNIIDSGISLALSLLLKSNCLSCHFYLFCLRNLREKKTILCKYGKGRLSTATTGTSL